MRVWHKVFCNSCACRRLSSNICSPAHLDGPFICYQSIMSHVRVFIHTSVSVCVQISWLRGARTHATAGFFVSLSFRDSIIGQWEFNWIKEQGEREKEKRKKEREREREREREGRTDSMWPYRLRSVYLFVLAPLFFFLIICQLIFQNEVKSWIHPSKFTVHRHVFGAGFALVFADTEGSRR